LTENSSSGKLGLLRTTAGAGLSVSVVVFKERLLERSKGKSLWFFFNALKKPKIMDEPKPQFDEKEE